MPDAQNDDLVLISYIVNHRMGLVWLRADRRSDILSQARGTGIVCEKREKPAQAFVIGVSMRQGELLHALKENSCKIIGCGAC